MSDSMRVLAHNFTRMLTSGFTRRLRRMSQRSPQSPLRRTEVLQNGEQEHDESHNY